MIKFTDEARLKAMEMIERQGMSGHYGIRIGVSKHGRQTNYHMVWGQTKLPGDAVIVQDRLVLYADFDSFHLLSDAVIDYVRKDEQECFLIRHQIWPRSEQIVPAPNKMLAHSLIGGVNAE